MEILWGVSKVIHWVCVISWFSALFYLPRLFVNLALDPHPAVQDRLILMAEKLYRFMSLLAAVSVISGLGLLFFAPIATWLYWKLLWVMATLFYHISCRFVLQQWVQGKKRRSDLWYRYFNEIPVLLLIAILSVVVFKNY